MGFRKGVVAMAALAGVIICGPAAQARGGGGGGGGHGGGGHGGHGHGGHTVGGGVYLPGRELEVPYIQPPTVDMPLDLTDAPVDRTQGVIQLHDVIALHTVRAADAIVLDDPVHGPVHDLPAGTVLARMVLHDSGQSTEMWCDMSAFDSASATVAYQCFSDPYHAGAVTLGWTANTNDAFLGYGGLEEVRERDMITAHARYHTAAPDQRPTGMIGYAWCAGDGAATPPRFEISGRFGAGAWTTSRTHACSFGAWPNADDHSTVLVDRLRLQTAPGPNPASLAYTVAGRIPATPLARLEPGGGVRTRAEAEAQAKDDDIILHTPQLVPSGDPAILSDHAVVPGEALFVIDARHPVTGVLVNDIWMGNVSLFGGAAPADRPALRAGAPVYALRVQSGDGSGHVVWCAPHKTKEDAFDAAACFPSDGVGPLWADEAPALMITDLLMPPGQGPYVTPPVVKRANIDLPTLELRYVFQGWYEGGVARIDLELNGDIVRRSLSQSTGKPTGESIMPVVGGHLLVKPDPRNPKAADVEFVQ